MNGHARPTASGACAYCGDATTTPRVVSVREMMFGLGARFDYAECAACGSLQRVAPVADFARYYPPGYYSHAPAADRPLARWLKRARARHVLGDGSAAGALAARWWGVPADMAAVAHARVPRSARVLDVGSGSGTLLHAMRAAGFTSLVGVDPFVDRDRDHADGVRILKRELADVEGRFDFAMLHHSLEHMPDAFAALATLRRVLDPAARVLVRVPVTGGEAWRKYGAEWVQLDAPRHVAVPSPAGLHALAARAGYAVDEVRYDSTALQFWGSEQYRRGIPLRAPNSHADNPRRSIFSRREIRRFTARASELNSQGDGDQASFYLRLAR